MTSKEALEKIEQYITNEKGRLCFFIKLYCGTIKQDLERLEAINNVWHKNEPMESVDINANHLKELYNYINKLQQENQILKQSVKDTYDTGQEIISELTQENEKLKKVIEILKKIVSIPLEDDFAKVKIDKETKEETHYYALSIKYLIDEQEYELLKEVLGE